MANSDFCPPDRSGFCFLWGLHRDRSGDLPRTLGTIFCGFVAIYDPIVLVGITYCAQGFVIEARKSEGFLQFLSELMKRFEVIGRRRNLGLRGLQKLLIALVH